MYEEEEDGLGDGFDAGDAAPAGGASDESVSDPGSSFDAGAAVAPAAAPEEEENAATEVGVFTADDAGVSGVPTPTGPEPNVGTSTSVENAFGGVNQPVEQPGMAAPVAASPVGPVVEGPQHLNNGYEGVPRDSVIAGFVNPELTADPAAVKAAQDAYVGFLQEARQNYSIQGYETPYQYMAVKGNYASDWLDSVKSLAQGQLAGGFRGMNWEPHVGWGYQRAAGVPSRAQVSSQAPASAPAQRAPQDVWGTARPGQSEPVGGGVFAASRNAYYSEPNGPQITGMRSENAYSPQATYERAVARETAQTPWRDTDYGNEQLFMAPMSVLDLERQRAGIRR